jgi:hypothetical protein
MRTGIVMWLALAIVVGVGMFVVKYKVQALEDELTAKREQIARDRGAIRVLDAEWTYLNDPERLRRLSAQHLGFGPAVPQNVIDIAGLPMRDPAARAGLPAPAAPGPSDLTNHAEAAPAPPAFERPGGLPVFLARLQRLLLPEAVGATTSATGVR